MGYRTLRYENNRKFKKEKKLKLALLLICILILIGGLYVVDVSLRIDLKQPDTKILSYKFINNSYTFLFFDEYIINISKDKIYNISNNISELIQEGISYFQGIYYKIYNKIQ